MKINAKKIAVTLYLIGAAYVTARELYDWYQIRTYDRKAKLQYKRLDDPAEYAIGVLQEEIKAGRYTPTTLEQLENDLVGLMRIYDPENK